MKSWHFMRILTIFLIVNIIITSSVITIFSAENKLINIYEEQNKELDKYSNYDPDASILAYTSKATINENFKSDCVIVVIKHDYSEVNKKYTTSDFDTSLFSEVKDLFYVDEYSTVDEINATKVNEEGFHQILSLKLKNPGKDNVLKAINYLSTLEEVLYAEPSYIYKYKETYVPNDTLYTEQWALEYIDIEKAWDKTRGSTSVKVGIFENGLSSHEDIADSRVIQGNLQYNSSEIHSHGTAVTGIIGATTNNNLGIAGVAQVKMSILDRNDFIGSLSYAANNNISIINASYYVLNSDGSPASYNVQSAAAIQNYSGLLICAAGNDNINLDETPYYPAAYDFDNVISVAASDEDEELYTYYENGKRKGSNYGATKVDLAAPGDYVYTTSATAENGYSSPSGTSMAAPYVTGVAALLKSKYPGMDAKAIKDYILSNVDVIPALANKVETGGRLNAYKALTGLKYFSIEFKPNGGGGSAMQNQRIIYGCATAIKNNTYTKAGNHFAGWTAYRPDDNTWYYTNGTDTDWIVEGEQEPGYRKYVYRNGQKVSRTGQKDGRVYLYAQWEPNEINIVFESNNATSGSMPMLTLVCNTPQGLPANTFTRAGCTFDHWYAKNADGKMYYTDGSNGGWYNMNEIPDNYTRMDLINRKTVQYTTFDDVTHGDTVVLCAYWKPNSGKLGDVDGNGSVSTSDVSTIQKHLNAQLTTPLTTNQLLRADVNFDGSVSVKDTSLIQKYIAQIIDEFGE